MESVIFDFTENKLTKKQIQLKYNIGWEKLNEIFKENNFSYVKHSKCLNCGESVKRSKAKYCSEKCSKNSKKRKELLNHFLLLQER